MSLTRGEVEHIADLARLGLTDQEKDLFAGQLSAILDYFTVLEQLDTTDIVPTTTAIPQENVVFNDEVTPSFPQDDILANAPDAVDGYFRVRAILD